MENNGELVTEMWAVVQTGVVLSDASIVVFQDKKGRPTPAIIFGHEEENRCQRMRKRIMSGLSRVKGIKESDAVVGTPILGVQLVSIEPRKKREGRKVSAEQIKKMQAGRAKAQKNKGK